MTQKRQILITSALPYANGSIHLGHLVEHVQADIWARFQKLRGHECLFICGDDAHGTPIMLKARQQGITPESLVNSMYQEHVRDFADFHIDFDNYYTTHSTENQNLVSQIYERLKSNGDIEVHTIEQAYDAQEEMFLPDRFVKGQCPKCGADDQHGDNCEACGAHYDPTELVNPASALSGSRPVHKTSEHYFFNLDHYKDYLRNWIHADTLQSEVANKLEEWFQQGLAKWDISRDAPYFGFEIPDHPGKYFYVWLDAPVGYMASLQNLCSRNPSVQFMDYWGKDSQAEVYHFVGKDIIYFHALFWPAMLKGADYRTPSAVYTHGFLTINGQKMSKSRGTFITAQQFAKHINPDCYRYYLAGKLSDSVEDLDFNFEDFVQRINSDLVGKYINIASRSAGFIHKKFQGKLADKLHNPDLLDHFSQQGELIADYYECRQYNKAIRTIMNLADTANQYINDQQPWVLVKDEDTQQKAHEVCTQALNMFRVLTVYLKPVIPDIASHAEAFLNEEELTWLAIQSPALDYEIQKFKPLLKRLEMEQVQAMTF